jgi:hypothetical protein
MSSAIDAWREQIEAHERDTSALRGGGHGHGDSSGDTATVEAELGRFEVRP